MRGRREGESSAVGRIGVGRRDTESTDRRCVVVHILEQLEGGAPDGPRGSGNWGIFQLPEPRIGSCCFVRAIRAFVSVEGRVARFLLVNRRHLRDVVSSAKGSLCDKEQFEAFLATCG
ncbi:hypothetical protein AXG93_1988s1140 [Marchantia polymorpha subsp. ruderalis]|uniref:Uncharacterized protein n=1 Tax=Marchantia polymorpha subsp. ruderalis TaxID=1480154 RepID=A0A176VVH8_MARPO|nr:hypothetical protein AXG93_1988s1140 [Marchantia polymorpha subsp. ruderalis]